MMFAASVGAGHTFRLYRLLQLLLQLGTLDAQLLALLLQVLQLPGRLLFGFHLVQGVLPLLRMTAVLRHASAAGDCMHRDAHLSARAVCWLQDTGAQQACQQGKAWCHREASETLRPHLQVSQLLLQASQLLPQAMLLLLAILKLPAQLLLHLRGLLPGFLQGPELLLHNAAAIHGPTCRSGLAEL